MSADLRFLLQSLSVLYFTENGDTSNLAIVNGASNKFLTDFHDVFSKEATRKKPQRERKQYSCVHLHCDTFTHYRSAVFLPQMFLVSNTH